jgi:hypothetical protein
VVLQWCYSGETVVLQWCHSGVTVVLQLCYSCVTSLASVTVVLQEYYNGVRRSPGQETAVLVVITLDDAASMWCSHDLCGVTGGNIGHVAEFSASNACSAKL